MAKLNIDSLMKELGVNPDAAKPRAPASAPKAAGDAPATGGSTNATAQSPTAAPVDEDPASGVALPNPPATQDAAPPRAPLVFRPRTGPMQPQLQDDRDAGAPSEPDRAAAAANELARSIPDTGREAQPPTGPADSAKPEAGATPADDAGDNAGSGEPRPRRFSLAAFSSGMVTVEDDGIRVRPREDQEKPRDDSEGGSLTEIYKPEGPTPANKGGSFKELLVQEGVASPRQVQQAEAATRQVGGARMTEILLGLGVDEEKMMRVLADSMGLGFERLKRDPQGFIEHDGTLLQRLGYDFCKENDLVPLRMQGERVVIGTSRPDDVFVLDDIRLRLGTRSLKQVVVPPSDIKAVLDSLGIPDAGNSELDVDSILDDVEEDDVQVEKVSEEEADLEREAAESPVIRYVNYIIHQAVKEGASDIHIEPAEKILKVRFRIDGELFESLTPPGKMSAAITSRLKIMANLDISERRLPQDGRIRCHVQGRKLDLRMSTIPTPSGEKVVLRILDTKSINVDLDALGFDADTLELWKHQIEEPHGIVLVTGPTGSGKTTTLYASLRQMDKVSQNVSTVEDPIEYHLEGITQTQTHEKIGMTFAAALRALLRQDPDVIMVGEIRDVETAATAVQASLTGHLVLSTLHTNDAPGSVTRLINIGIEPFLIGAAMNAALAQRLVRRICQQCKREVKPSDDVKELMDMQGMSGVTLYEGAGCPKCRNTGYSGRVGLYELLVIDDSLRDIIARNPNVAEFRRLCCERGMVTLRQDGFAKVAKGYTTFKEVLRATSATI